MEMVEMLGQLVQTVGVPVVSLGCVMWYVNQLDLRQREERNNWYASHDSESQRWTDAINSNTQVMERLCTLIDSMRGAMDDKG